MGIQERKEREKEKRRQQILAAAKKVFSEKGYSKATMEDIANKAELSPGTLYLYFKNKEELYASLSLRVLKYFLAGMEKISRRKDLEPEKKLDGFINAMFDLYKLDSLVIVNVFRLQSSEALQNLSHEVLEGIKNYSRDLIASFASAYKEGVDKGIFLDKSPVAIADIFWALFSGVILWEESKRIIDSEKNFILPTLETAFKIFKRGIKQNL